MALYERAAVCARPYIVLFDLLFFLFFLLVAFCSGCASCSSAQGEDGKALYTQFDDNGVPTHDAAGEPIVKDKARENALLLTKCPNPSAAYSHRLLFYFEFLELFLLRKRLRAAIRPSDFLITACSPGAEKLFW